MRKSLLLIVLAFFTKFSVAQIELNPSGSKNGSTYSANLDGIGNRPYWLGVGGYPHIYLDSSVFHKVGLGTSLIAPNSTRNHNYHAKLHIRHSGGLVSNQNNSAGPHLLLDEATSNFPAVLRFRQSIISSTGIGPTLNETLVPSARYWDIRGFANAINSNNDIMTFYNSGNSHDTFSLSANGEMTLTNSSSPKLVLKYNSYNNSSKIEFGEIGQSINEGRIWYVDRNLEFYSNSIKGLSIGPHGHVSIGSDPLAPKIKTWLNTINLPLSPGMAVLQLPTLGVNIISVNITVRKDNNEIVGITDWVINNSQDLVIPTTISGTGGQTATVYVTYFLNPSN